MIPVAALAPDPSTLFLKVLLNADPSNLYLKVWTDSAPKARIKKLGGKDAVFVEGGGILGGETSIPGDVSSQFISGLMFACPMAKVDTEITLNNSP